MNSISQKDLDFILESLSYTRDKFENYDKYPSYEYKQKRINDVNEVMAKVNRLKKELADNGTS